MGGLISDLQALIKRPSILQKQGLIECADLVASIMNKHKNDCHSMFHGLTLFHINSNGFSCFHGNSWTPEKEI
jgi:acetylornithine deacetylase/succinyl-diaminopimelate desuccinylase-like protein